MERFCMELDACRATAYLETDLDKNVRFYERFGFKVVSETKIFDAKNLYMLRLHSPVWQTTSFLDWVWQFRLQ